jgi:predicted nucleotide-binding protein (sugar kinase/HSP70/actin superfamily)
MEPGVRPEKISFFMPDHNGPCRFGQYNRFQRLLFDKLGYKDTMIVSPSNDVSYEDISGGHGTKFRFNAWKGFVAVDMLRKFYQERKPYEITEGSVKLFYENCLQDVIKCLENKAKDLPDVILASALRFDAIPLDRGIRKPIVAVVGEIFMRDNAFCSGNLVQKLEAFGAEKWIVPFAEWLSFSTLRYHRDSV